jgi:hypothetical protein
MSTRYFRSIIIILVVAVCLLNQSAYGEYRDVTTKVNVNEQTDLFEKSTGDYVGLQRQIEGQKDAGIEAVKSGSSMDWLVEKSSQDIKHQTDELSNIRANDLNSRGTTEMVKQNVINELHVDYSRPLNKQHLDDAKKIAKGQDELMRNLLAKLQDIGVDCKTVKGGREQEPTYYLKVEQTPIKNTIYNKTICEELRNKYQCNDAVTPKCTKKAMQWEPWQKKTIKLLYQEIPDHWWVAGRQTDSTYPGRNGHGASGDVKTINPAYHDEVRKYIALKEDVLFDQINVQKQDIVFDHYGHFSRNVDQRNCSKQTMWLTFYYASNAVITFAYEYRDGKEICEQWQEDWTERCRLQ